MVRAYIISSLMDLGATAHSQLRLPCKLAVNYCLLSVPKLRGNRE